MIIFEMGGKSGKTHTKGAYTNRKEMINEVKPFIQNYIAGWDKDVRQRFEDDWCKLSFMYGLEPLHEQKVFLRNITEETLNDFLNSYKGN